MTPLPKRRHSSRRQGKREKSVLSRVMPQVHKCKKCGHAKLPHTACPKCGNYK